MSANEKAEHSFRQYTYIVNGEEEEEEGREWEEKRINWKYIEISI